MKLRMLILLSLITVLSCKKAEKETVAPDTNSSAFFVGTYTDGNSKGIYRYALNDDGSLDSIGVMAETINPSFLAKTTDGRYLLAVNEVSNIDSMGTVSSYKIAKDSLLFNNKSASGGTDPCHITINDAGYTLVANYSSGSVGLLQVHSDGMLSPLLDSYQHQGSGSTERQKGPHAHSDWFYGPDHFISVDLGTNALWFSKIDTTADKIVLTSPDTLKMHAGAGPRHLALHPNKKWIYVINELNSTIQQVLKTNDSTYTPGITVSTLPVDFSGESYCADIHISKDGRFLYGSNRGHNSIAIFSIDPENGNLSTLGYEPVHGNWPRNFTFSPDEKFLLVANQRSDNIVSFKRDAETGLLEYLSEIHAPSPVCLLF